MLIKSYAKQEKRIEFWNQIAADWPPILLAKECDRKTLQGFPYSKNYFRNLLTGKTKDETIPTFRVGKLLAVTKAEMVGWLARRTS
jgi:hypothetical protein